MNRKMERPIFIRDTDPLRQGSTLVVGIDKKGHISRFNETLEQLTGSSKEDVIDVPFSTYFSKQIPEEELKNLINQARFNPDSVDIDTSFQTVNGENVIVSWTGFPIKNEDDGRVSQLNLVGTPQNNVNSAQAKKSNKKKKATSAKKSISSKSKNKNQDTSKNKRKKETISTGSEGSDTKKESKQKKTAKKKKSKRDANKTKKDSEKKDTSKNNSKTSKKTGKKESSKKSSTKKSKKKVKLKRKSKKAESKKKAQSEKTSEKIEEQDDQTKADQEHTEKPIKKPSFGLKNRFPKIKSKITKKSKKHSVLPQFSKKEDSLKLKKEAKKEETPKSLKTKIKKLQKENKKFKQENSKLEKQLESAKFKRNEIKNFFNSKFRFIRDSIAIRKKRDEFQQMMQQLSERKEKLEQLEADMVLEKKEFKQKIEEFITWREKLEKLEEEIEKRRQFLSEQETFLNKQYDKVLSHELEQPASYTQQPEQEKAEPEKDKGILEKDDLFNSLTVEAAVLQRGRIKKANKRFAKMLGYSEDELVGKHLVDFVGPTGLPGVEQHYMNRLKGVDDASYKTVFLSKEENEIPVKVNVKTGDFQGERAEIAIFNEV